MAEPSFLTSTRAAYDAIAADYAERFSMELAAKPFGRAVLGAFAELVQAADAGPVADVGSGPGNVTAHLDSLGLDVFGVDLSPEMVALARGDHAHLRFDEGSMIALEMTERALGGIVSWYSIIHVPPDLLPLVFSEFHRVLAPGGYLLLAFQIGDEPLHFDSAFGHEISLDFHRLVPDRVEELLTDAGFFVVARLTREPDEDEKVSQAHIVARRAEIPTSADPNDVESAGF